MSTIQNPAGSVAAHPPTMDALYQLMTKVSNVMNTRFDGLSRQLLDMKNEIRDLKTNVTDLESGLQHIDQDMIELKEDTLPKLEQSMKLKIAELEDRNLEAELYSKRSTLLFFNIKPSSHEPEDTELILREVLKSTVPDADSITFANVHTVGRAITK